MSYWIPLQAVYSWAQNLILWTRQTWRDFIVYLAGLAKINKLMILGDVRVLHTSCHFLVIDKPYDVLINSNDPTVQVVEYLYF